mmetsp:Transcript_37634/g.83789  ORF Transcript_37634/g.83789 Transcript_37634/m.83789 type:complete len:80 (+) Transcript_37634:388-627(+)
MHGTHMASCRLPCCSGACHFEIVTSNPQPATMCTNTPQQSAVGTADCCDDMSRVTARTTAMSDNSRNVHHWEKHKECVS